jgi:REP element-mobilizing transposase RayT
VNSESAPVLGLSDVVHRFKTLTTYRYFELQHDRSTRPAGLRLWQRNYYEHVIRDYDSLQRMREYITNNHLAWALDRENPSFTPVPAHTTTPIDPWQV